MIAIAKASDTEREVLFGNAANRAGISNLAIVEKDFWVYKANTRETEKSLSIQVR